MKKFLEKKKSSPKDVFMHLFSVGMLYTLIAGILTLLFEYINIAFPDPLNLRYDSGNTIRWFLALVIIIFPVFLWTSRFLYRDLRDNPEKNELKTRKWLLYFTLFAAAILIMGDLVALLYSFLQGELTARFLLKAGSILLVAAGIFGYYFYELRRSPEEFSNRARYFVRAVIVIVAAIVVYGLFAAGSPFKQRLARFDEEKVSHLEVIQGQIVNFWTQKGRLPISLDELKDSISGFSPPYDPQTGESYIYRPGGEYSFELCADFNLESKTGKLKIPEPISPFGRGENWEHGAERVCFKRTIDPELYRKKSESPAPVRRPIIAPEGASAPEPKFFGR